MADKGLSVATGVKRPTLYTNSPSITRRLAAIREAREEADRLAVSIAAPSRFAQRLEAIILGLVTPTGDGRFARR